jgi:branched-chain amino acid transport system permease protein
MPSDYVIERATAAHRWGFAALILVIAVLAALPMWGSGGEMRLMVEFCYYMALAQMWNLLAGYSGLVSVGQQAFVGLGSYSFIVAASFLGLSPYLALPLAGLVAAVISLPTSFLMFRLHGPHFAIGTWALAEVFRLLFTQMHMFGAGTGLSLPVAVVKEIAADRETRDMIVYYIALAIGVGSVLAVFFWLRSRSGLALTAIRDSVTAAASVGIDRRHIRLLAYVLAAAFGGLVGALVMLQKLRITPGAGFSVGDWSANVIFIVVIGGIGSIEGPIIGAIVFFALRAALADYGSWYLIVMGLIAISVMLLAPKGIWGFVSERFEISLFPVRHRVRFIEGGVMMKPSGAYGGKR